MEERAGAESQRGDLNWEAAFDVNFFCFIAVSDARGGTVREGIGGGFGYSDFD
jgi:hypothetical protein